MRVTQFLFALAFIAACLNCTIFAQSLEKTTNKAQSVGGRVTIHGKGHVGATVLAWPWPSTEQQPDRTFTAQTDQEGNYRITNLEPGNYYISARAPGFAAMENGEPAQPKYFSLAAGQTVNDIDFEIVRAGVVSGTATNGDGQPVAEEPVTLIRVQASSAPSAAGAESGKSFPARTDDRGAYRFFGIPPGRYKAVIGWACVAMASVKGRPGYDRVFYPGVADEAKAKVIEVAEGLEVSNIDFNVGAPVKVFSLRGKVVDKETGQPIPNLNYGLDILVDGKPRCGISQAGSTNGQGEFRIENLPSGKYSMRVPPSLMPMSGPPPAFFSELVPIEINTRDVTDVVVNLMRTTSVSGVIVIEGTTDKTALEKLSQVLLDVTSLKIGAPVSHQRSRIGADGSFSVSGLRPGQLYWQVAPPFQLKRIERGNTEQKERIELKTGDHIGDIRLVVAYATATVNGSVKFENGTLRSDARVVARLWSSEQTQSGMPVSATFVDATGHFVMQNVPAGTYRLVVSAESATQGKAPMVASEIVVKEGTVSQVTVTLDLTP